MCHPRSAAKAAKQKGGRGYNGAPACGLTVLLVGEQRVDVADAVGKVTNGVGGGVAVEGLLYLKLHAQELFQAVQLFVGYLGELLLLDQGGPQLRLGPW